MRKGTRHRYLGVARQPAGLARSWNGRSPGFRIIAIWQAFRDFRLDSWPYRLPDYSGGCRSGFTPDSLLFTAQLGISNEV